jgi:YidC/Oxa1 family membrane protein insertase
LSKRKRLLFTVSLFAVMIVLSACGTEPITSNSTGTWDHYVVYNFSRLIIWFSELFFNNFGLGIIAFTLVIRVVLLPLNHFQTKSTKKMAAVQPQIKELQAKYASKDRETQEMLQMKTSKLYQANDVNPYMGCLPAVVQMPVLMALYQSISRTEILKTGSFLWMNLGERDQFFILPVVAAILTYATSKLTMMSQPDGNPAMKSMTYTMPVMILMMGINFPSALSLYWVASNAFSVGQTLLLNNPFKANKERQAAEAQRKAREKALQKAQNPKKKRK